MHMGQIIQSHGMHFFELAGPDLLLGFDADPAVRNVIGLIGANPALALKAVNLRKFGQCIIQITWWTTDPSQFRGAGWRQ